VGIVTHWFWNIFTWHGKPTVEIELHEADVSDILPGIRENLCILFYILKRSLLSPVGDKRSLLHDIKA
jgi:hypothetical protein